MNSTLLRWLAWPLLIVLNIATCLLLFITAVFGTDYGTQQAVAAAQRWLPLNIESVEGNVLDTLSLRNLRYNDDNMTVQSEYIHWELDLAALWGKDRRLHIKSLQLHSSTVRLKTEQSDDAAKPTKPFSLQSIKLPIGITVDRLSLQNVSLQQAGATHTVDSLELRASATSQGDITTELSLINGPYNSHALLKAKATMNENEASIRLNIQHANAEWNELPIQAKGALTLAYDGDSMSLNADKVTANLGTALLSAEGRLAENDTLSFQLTVPDLTLATPELGGNLELSGTINNAKQLNLKASLNHVRWLGQPQLNQADIVWQGALAEQSLNATIATPLLGTQPLNVTSQFGWRDSFKTLLSASKLPAEALLKQPPLHFKAQLKLAQADIAASGARLQNNHVNVALSPTGEIQVNGSSDSGNGNLTLTGLLNVIDSHQQNIALNATLNGTQYQLANTPELRISASPKLQAVLADQQLMLRGDITVDSGHIEIIVPETGAVSSSSDVVIIEDDQTASNDDANRNRQLSRDVDIQLIIANPITLEGQGFKGTASGKISVVEQPGKAPRARGDLILSGQYKAYGQDLTIRRGKLIYVDSPIDDPGVDLEAIRTIHEQIAGVRVSGLASNPNIQIFAEPALSETEALSYLVLGRGFDDNSEQDQVQLRSLALSLGLAKGGDFLEKSKDKLGVDELSIQTGDSNNQASLLVGRQLSKRLYLSTQIGLFEPVAKLFLRYTLSRKCEFIAETGTQQGADVVCTLSSEP